MVLADQVLVERKSSFLNILGLHWERTGGIELLLCSRLLKQTERGFDIFWIVALSGSFRLFLLIWGRSSLAAHDDRLRKSSGRNDSWELTYNEKLHLASKRVLSFDKEAYNRQSP